MPSGSTAPFISDTAVAIRVSASPSCSSPTKKKRAAGGNGALCVCRQGSRLEDAKLAEWDGHHREEVSELESMIQKIGELEPADSKWMEAVKKLRQTLEHHIQEEEGDVWPRIQRVWDQDKLALAGEQMATLKRQKMQQAA